jgi:hypothetical protein
MLLHVLGGGLRWGPGLSLQRPADGWPALVV